MLAQALRDVYYEPLAQVMPSVDAILNGPPVMKLLFMTDPNVVDAKLKPDWQVAACYILLLTCNLNSSNCYCSGNDDLHSCTLMASLICIAKWNHQICIVVQLSCLRIGTYCDLMWVTMASHTCFTCAHPCLWQSQYC